MKGRMDRDVAVLLGAVGEEDERIWVGDGGSFVLSRAGVEY